jgi:hypothetical protein
MPSVFSSSSMTLARSWMRLPAVWTGEVAWVLAGWGAAGWDAAGWDAAGWDGAGWAETAGRTGRGPTRSPPGPAGPFASAGPGRRPSAESDPAAIDLAVACSTSSR